MCLRRRSRLNVYKRVRLNAARLDAAAQLEKVADGRDTDEKLAQAGIGATNKSNAQGVLARLQRQQGE